MDFFDILWLLICIGLPVISGIASAKKKNAGKGKSVPQNSEVPAESDLKEIFKSIIQEMNAQDADEDEEDEDELEEVKPAQVQVNAAEPVRFRWFALSRICIRSAVCPLHRKNILSRNRSLSRYIVRYRKCVRLRKYVLHPICVQHRQCVR